jgi:ferritin
LNDYGNDKIIALLTQAANMAAHGQMYHHKMMLWTQAHGFQGHKRLHRHESGEDRRQCIAIQNYALDMFGEIIEPSWNYAAPSPGGLQEYLNEYLDWENSVYTKLGEIIAALCADGFSCEAELVREGLNRKEIERVRRMIAEYALSGWDMPYILEKDRELHSKMKDYEKTHGY